VVASTEAKLLSIAIADDAAPPDPADAPNAYTNSLSHAVVLSAGVLNGEVAPALLEYASIAELTPPNSAKTHCTLVAFPQSRACVA
jgi:hypothetical protein